MPEKILDCPPNSMIYKYPKLNYDYDKTIVEKLSFNIWINYTIELCMVIYYLNHNTLMYPYTKKLYILF